MRRLVIEPAGSWFRGQVGEVTDPILHRVEYHLGPNGDTTPLHMRVIAISDRLEEGDAKFQAIEKQIDEIQAAGETE